MSNKTILTIDDLMQPFQLLHMADQYGRAVNMAEMLVESRDVDGEVSIDKPDKHFSGERYFIGKLAGNTAVKVSVYVRLGGPFHKMLQEEWGFYVANNVWKEGEEDPYPSKGDVMAIYWLSKHGKLPKVYPGGVMYVNPCGYKLPFSRNSPKGKHEFIFRGLDTDQGEYRTKIKQFIKLTYDDFEYITGRDKKDSVNYSIFMGYVDKEVLPDDIEELTEVDLIPLVKKEYGRNMGSTLDQNKSRIVDYHSFLTELLLKKYEIAYIVNVMEKRRREYCCFYNFASISSFFASDIISELKNVLGLKDKGGCISLEDAEYLIGRSLTSAISTEYNISVVAKYGSFGGGERRRMKPI